MSGVAVTGRCFSCTTTDVENADNKACTFGSHLLRDESFLKIQRPDHYPHEYLCDVGGVASVQPHTEVRDRKANQPRMMDVHTGHNSQLKCNFDTEPGMAPVSCRRATLFPQVSTAVQPRQPTRHTSLVSSSSQPELDCKPSRCRCRFTRPAYHAHAKGGSAMYRDWDVALEFYPFCALELPYST